MSEGFNFKVEDLIDAKAIARGVQEKLLENIGNTICWQVQDAVKKEVLLLLEPEIKQLVADSKEGILLGIKNGIPAIAKRLAEDMLVTATKNMNGYNGGDILQKIFAR